MKDSDLHTHSYFSDGQFSPTELIKQAKEADIKHIALTDHNSVDGVEEAIKAGKELGIEVIPGCEIRAEYGEILAYFIDIKNQQLKDLLKDILKRGKDRNRKMIALLNKDGLNLDYDEINDEEVGQMNRLHMAKAIIKNGFAKDVDDAFDKYLGRYTKYCVPAKFPPSVDVIKIIKQAGGAASLAHPWFENWNKEFQEIDLLIEAGLDGMEISCGPVKDREKEMKIKEKIREICRSRDLVMTSGSDYHGPMHKDHILGNHNCDSSIVEELRKRAKK